MKVLIREYNSSDFPQVKKLILDAENFGEPFLETEILNIKKNTTLGLGKVFVATVSDQIQAIPKPVCIRIIPIYVGFLVKR